MATKIPPTLLTLPAEIREQIWDYCLVSPTHRVFPVCYLVVPAANPQDPPEPTCALDFKAKYGKPLYIAACPARSPSPLPLAHALPLTNRQLYVETSTRLWSTNTLVLSNYAIVKEVLAHLGKASLRVQSVELTIGNVWDLEIPLVVRMREVLRELARLVQEGALRKLRLIYVDGGACDRGAFDMWKRVLLNSRRESDWGGCERELVWEENEMKTGRLREVLARRWGLEAGVPRRLQDIWRWDNNITDKDWEPVKPLEGNGE
ncbi:hypothetical protein VE00_05164 [Pseudogymnoascus sp. WSF 3629]|nr:hypothetical protein VE00_05164 [Pseudogymnoascus sp. WSF 3629]